MTKPNSSEIVFVLDRSGSMRTIRGATEESFNGLVVEQRKLPQECKVTLAQFDNEYEIVYRGKPLADVPSLVLEPRGNTALLDAIGRTIAETGKRLSAMKEDDRPSQVLFVIITDGHENASTDYTREKIHQMITHQREAYHWEFVFLGAGLDAVQVAKDYGISAGNAVSYQASHRGTEALLRGMSRNLGTYRSKGKAVMDMYCQADYDKDLAEAEKQSSKP